MRRLSLIAIILILIVLGFQRIKSPHGEAFNISCKNCHSTDSWKLNMSIYSFNHDKTLLPLEGQHQVVECRKCHESLVFSQSDPECVSCHTDIHYNTVGVFCADCHTPHNWLVNNIYEIHQSGRFPLLGAHNTNECKLCHPSASLLRFEPLGIECIDCHLEDYNATTSPDHISGAYSMHCTDCHKSYAYSWTGAGINHDFFPLIQGHAMGDCYQCHTEGTNFAALDTDCYSCHQTAFNATTNPNHVSAAIPTDCVDCHTLSPDWTPATFDIHNEYYPLLGAHAVLTDDCNSCHDGNYTNTPNTCVGCHLSDYNSVNDPPHQAANFSTDCELCHTQDAWEPSTFDHDGQYFPIYSGEHSGEWESCTDCHTISTNYSLFSCIDCHEHAQTEMDDEHSDVNDYIYSSLACLECHPVGKADELKRFKFLQ